MDIGILYYSIQNITHTATKNINKGKLKNNFNNIETKSKDRNRKLPTAETCHLHFQIAYM